MIITFLKIDNLYGFKNTELDMSYSRKVANNTIPNEYLADRPSFNFKRVCIISGTNASGKTSLGRVICGLENFIARKNITSSLSAAICDKNIPASIEVEFVTPSNNTFHRLELLFIDSSVAIRRLLYISHPIGLKDSCYSMRNKIKLIKNRGRTLKGCYINSDLSSISEAFEQFSSQHISDMAWMFMFSENRNEDRISSDNIISDNIFERILKTFDSSIFSVESVSSSKNKKIISGYVIKFHNGDSVLINISGEIAGDQESITRFSKGTYDAIKLTSFISRVISEQKLGHSCTHFLDEQMAYSHSHLEQHILNLIIDKLSPTSQFFYTTHNYDVLDMGLPVHSFLFMKKNNNFTSIIQPEKTFNKNDRNLSNYVKNDYFNTLPDTSKIDHMIWDI